jgi:hypothetical protein
MSLTLVDLSLCWQKRLGKLVYVAQILYTHQAYFRIGGDALIE